ncbi:UNVERIFIED_CONTAM: hypothetical protein FKN15_073292 [Acipenser sinensis]
MQSTGLTAAGMQTEGNDFRTAGSHPPPACKLLLIGRLASRVYWRNSPCHVCLPNPWECQSQHNRSLWSPQ